MIKMFTLKAVDLLFIVRMSFNMKIDYIKLQNLSRVLVYRLCLLINSAVVWALNACSEGSEFKSQYCFNYSSLIHKIISKMNKY